MANKNKIPRSVFGRASKIILSSSTMIGKELTGRITAKITGNDAVDISTRLKQAKELVETLGQMKGAAMKVGQFLSMEMASFLPEEVTEVLRKLHDDSTFLPKEDIDKILLKSLGKEKFAKIQNLSEEPIAAASIGQVHKAAIDGVEVAIKIQFPGVAETIDSDVALIQKLAESYSTISGKKIDLKPVFEEVKFVLNQEVDYVNEAKNTNLYRKAFEGDTRFRVPSILEEYSSKNVLTLSFEKGTKLNNWIKGNPNEAKRKAFSENIMSLLIKEFFELGIVQTDSNYGNFLYDEETDQIVLLDFGATKQYDIEFRRNVIELLNTGLLADEEKLLQQSYDIEFIDAKESASTKRIYLNFIECVLDMITEELQPYDFSDTSNLLKLREHTIELVKAVKYSQPAKNMMFLDRKIGGVYLLIKEMNCRLNLHEYFEDIKKLEL